MSEHSLRVNNRRLTITTRGEATISPYEVLDRAGFDPLHYALFADAGGHVEFADRAGDRLGRVALDEHEQVIARRTYD